MKMFNNQENLIPFVKPYLTTHTKEYLERVLENNHFHGDGNFTKSCHDFLKSHTHSSTVLITHSCTAALEMAMILIDLKAEDEVIMPSYTFSSTANCVALRNAIPVFVDIREDTLNIDENLIEASITSKTKAILPVHYAGVGAEMNTINKIAQNHNLYVIEDAAQALGATYQDKVLGTLGHMGAYSFHGTKNIISGEGGAFISNDKRFEILAEIIREKGTNRSQFLRGEIDKYTWQDIGSSYLPNEFTAAFLFSQFQELESINERRLKIWNIYHEELLDLERKNVLKRPVIPFECKHNAHMYYIILNLDFSQDEFIKFMKGNGIQCTSHYVPLHSAPAGLKYGKAYGDFNVTNRIANQIVRLPLWPQMSENEILRVIKTLTSFFEN